MGTDDASSRAVRSPSAIGRGEAPRNGTPEPRHRSKIEIDPLERPSDDSLVAPLSRIPAFDTLDEEEDEALATFAAAPRPPVPISSGAVEILSPVEAESAELEDASPPDADPITERSESRRSPYAGTSLVGTMLAGRYRIVERIGDGAMGVVYRARQTNINRDVAVKVLSITASRDAGLVERFRNEARIISELRHPNTLKIFDFGETEDGRLYVVVELLVGHPLDEILKRGPLDPARVIHILEQVADSLVEAHEKGVIHRDLKPGNIFIERVGGKDVAKVLDFGIAKLSLGAPQTLAGTLIGTPAYMSPEQARGDEVDPRADLYSLGVIAYECLTGRRPFDATTRVGLLLKQIHDDPIPLGQVAPEFADEDFTDVVMRLLKKDRSQRYPSADALRRDLARLKRAYTTSRWVGLGPNAPSRSRSDDIPSSSKPSSPANPAPPKAPPAAPAPPVASVAPASPPPAPKESTLSIAPAAWAPMATTVELGTLSGVPRPVPTQSRPPIALALGAILFFGAVLGTSMATFYGQDDAKPVLDIEHLDVDHTAKPETPTRPALAGADEAPAPQVERVVEDHAPAVARPPSARSDEEAMPIAPSKVAAPPPPAPKTTVPEAPRASPPKAPPLPSEATAQVAHRPKRGPESYDQLMQAAHKQRARRRTKKALEYYLRAVSLRPDSAEAIEGAAWCHLELNHPEEARAQFQRAIGANRHYAPSYFGLAEAYLALGKKDKALRAYEIFVDRSRPGEERTKAEQRIKKLKLGQP